MTYIPPNPNGSATSANSAPVVIASDQVAIATKFTGTAGSATVFAPGELRVAVEGTQLFFDAFDGGLDTLNRWKSPSSGGGGVSATSAPGSGGTTIASGSTANGYSVLESQMTFQATDPGYLYQRTNLNIEFAVLTTGYRFWGRAQTPAAPTIATPVNEGVGFEIRTDGKLYAVMYAGGTRNVIGDLSVATGNSKQPADASAHDYIVFFKGNIMYWTIDSPDNIVASVSSGVLGPNYNSLPLKYMAVSNSGTQVTLAINSVVIGDTARNGVQLVDRNYPWKGAVIQDNGSLRISSGQPTQIQKKSSISTGSVSNLIVTFDSIHITGNTIIVSCGVGNGTQPTVTDSNGNTYLNAKNIANGVAFNTSIFYASNIVSGARNTITVTNGGAAASIAVEVYEIDALLSVATTVIDQTASATGTSTTPSTASIFPTNPNEYVFGAIGVGTSAQTVIPGNGWANDSGQLNPTTPSGLFSFVAVSQFSGSFTSLTPTSTIVSEPWAIVAVTFRPLLLGIEGTVRITDGTSNVTVKPASTAPVAGDTSLVVVLSPTTGHTSAMVTATVASSATAETLITITKSIGLAATGTSTSTTITTGKRFHIQAIAASARNSTGTTAGVATIKIRAAVAGVTSTASPLQLTSSVALPAATTSVLFPNMSISDGFEIDSNSATNTYGVTITHPQWVSGTVVATFDISIIGYEY